MDCCGCAVRKTQEKVAQRAEEKESQEGLVFNPTKEFVRSIQYDIEEHAAKADAEAKAVKAEVPHGTTPAASVDAMELEDKKPTPAAEEERKDDVILEAEPLVSGGLMATLSMLRQKGALNEETQVVQRVAQGVIGR